MINDAEALKAYVEKILAYEMAIDGDNTPLAKLLTLVGRHLTGRRLGCRMRRSVYSDSGVKGCFYPTPRNGGVIDIIPGQSITEIYRKFLHESGHGKHHYKVVEENEFVLMEPGSFESAPPVINMALSAEVRAELEREELEANEQRDAWDAYASDPARLRSVGYDPRNPDYPIEFYKLHVLAYWHE